MEKYVFLIFIYHAEDQHVSPFSDNSCLERHLCMYICMYAFVYVFFIDTIDIDIHKNRQNDRQGNIYLSKIHKKVLYV